MFQDIFINATILISFIFVGSQMFKNTNLNPTSSIYLKFLLGLLGGILGIVLMLFTLHVTPSILLDFRHVPIVIIAAFGGFVPAFVSGLIIALFRLLHLGISIQSMVAATNMLLAGIGCGLISFIRTSHIKKWVYLNLCCFVFISSTFIILIKNASLLAETLIYFWVSSIIIGALVYYLVQYLVDSITMYIKFKEESKKDFLTSLNNVRQFDFLINEAMNNVKEKNERLSLIILDIDYFKKVNDTYGHPAGDAILKQLAVILSKQCRSFDYVSRIGGEEFSILLPDCPEPVARQIAEKTRAAVQNNRFVLPNGQSINITISAGISSYPDTTKNLDNLISEADSRLYEAKQSGRNRVC